MTEAEILSDIDALTSDFVWRVDSGRAGSVATLFARGAHATVGEQRIDRSDLLQRFEERGRAAYRTRHALTNRRLLSASGESACVAWLVTVTRLTPGDPEPRRTVSLADWTIAYIREDARWRIASIDFATFDGDR